MSETQILHGGSVTPSGILVNADQITVGGDGSEARPLHVLAAIASPTLTVAGTAFVPDVPPTAPAAINYSLNGLGFTSMPVGNHSFFSGLTLPVGRQIENAQITVIDSIGTILQAELRDRSGTPIGVSVPSAGNGTQQTLTIPIASPFTVQTGQSYNLLVLAGVGVGSGGNGAVVNAEIRVA